MFHKRRPPAGARPGSLMVPQDSPAPRINVMRFSERTLQEEQDVRDLASLAAHLDDPETITWIDVQGLGDEGILRRLAEIFAIHPLTLEDIVHVPQRPKIETGEAHDFITLRMALVTEPPDLDIEQVSLIVGRNYVLQFQERYGDVLDPVRARIRRGGGPIRRLGAGYLAYAIIDAIIDGYYPVLENLGDHIEDLEDRLVEDPSSTDIGQINATKRALLTLRRAAWPLRDALNNLLRDGSEMFPESVHIYLRDCYDHAVQVMDIVETFREIAGGLIDVYLSSVSNRMNEVMKMLTVMASIFIPLTFIAGIYGMNFENMPELRYEFAYPIVMAAMFLLGIGMFGYFRRRGWL